MKILADENTRRDIVEWLRAIGHDVTWIKETSPGVSDESILDMAIHEERIVISADLDFGEMVVYQGRAAKGILITRIGSLPTGDILNFFQQRWSLIEPLLAKQIVILTPHRIRFRPL